MTSIGYELKIYPRGVMPNILIYGGLGHCPLPYGELILCESCLKSYLPILYFYRKHTRSWFLVGLFAFCKNKYEVPSPCSLSNPRHSSIFDHLSCTHILVCILFGREALDKICVQQFLRGPDYPA